MSSRNLARRTKAEVSFGGIDITKSIQPYLLSISYTDNEEDETDDLQIKILFPLLDIIGFLYFLYLRKYM